VEIVRPLIGDQARFGDLDWYRYPDGHIEVRAAPPLTRIALAMLSHFTVDDHGINIADQVWYRPIDVDEATMALICRKVRDMRPVMAQSAEEVATGAGRGVC
jgi:hypothetical protein